MAEPQNGSSIADDGKLARDVKDAASAESLTMASQAAATPGE